MYLIQWKKATLEGIMVNDSQVQTLQDVIVGKNQLTKSLWESIENSKAQLMDR